MRIADRAPASEHVCGRAVRRAGADPVCAYAAQDAGPASGQAGAPFSRQSNPVRAPRSASPGFTLIELVIVMAIIALLLTLAVPRYFRTIDNGKYNVQRQNIATIRDAIDKFYGDQARYPESLDELVRLKYLREVPIDPLTQSPDWVPVPPPDPTLGGVYDVRSASKPEEADRAS